MRYETKAGSVGGSITTVIPSALANLLKIKKGNKIIWDIDISDEGTVIILSVKKNKDEK